MALGIMLVLGGARSGKSELGELLAARASATAPARDTSVTYVATAPARPADEDWACRVAAHRSRRPEGWQTLETEGRPDLDVVLEGITGTVLVDSLGSWVASSPGMSGGTRPRSYRVLQAARPAAMRRCSSPRRSGSACTRRASQEGVSRCARGRQPLRRLRGRPGSARRSGSCRRSCECRAARSVDRCVALSPFSPRSAGRGRRPRERSAWFPVVGAAIGALLGVAWWGSGKAWPAGVGAAIVVAADLALTGMLHLDGLLDSADGLLPHLDRERRLEVMRDHSVGAFGMAAGGAVLLLRWSALSAVRPSVLLLVGIWATSRACMAVAAQGDALRADGPGRRHRNCVPCRSICERSRGSPPAS